MKELSIEEKAKRYDEALEKARQLCAYPTTKPFISDLQDLFPELKESEDERIRKQIISFLKEFEHDHYRSLDFSSWITWLEKQGEQKSVEKVEPKFKVGDWAVENEPNSYARFIQILEIVNVQGEGMYRISRDIHNDEDKVAFDFVERYYHKFDIKDAKDGDVLCTYECDEPRIIFILKGTPKKNYALRYYCYYNLMCPYFEPNSGTGCLAVNEEDVKPATKEQRDKLEEAMLKAGYKWDADKKN